MNEGKTIRVTDLILILTIIVLGFFLMKGCNEVGYYKGLNDQNTKALTDTVEYYKGNYTKVIYKAHNERLAMEMAEKDKEIQILIKQIKDLKAKPLNLPTCFCRYKFGQKYKRKCKDFSE